MGGPRAVGDAMGNGGALQLGRAAGDQGLGIQNWRGRGKELRKKVKGLGKMETPTVT